MSVRRNLQIIYKLFTSLFPPFTTERPFILQKMICNPRFVKSTEMINQLKLLLLKMADRLGAAMCILLELESPDKVYHQKRRILTKILLYLYLEGEEVGMQLANNMTQSKLSFFFVLTTQEFLTFESLFTSKLPSQKVLW